MSRFRPRRPSAALVISIVALVMALGGTAYAGITLGKNSVGTKQLKNNAVTTKKIKKGAVTGSKLNLKGVTVPNSAQLGGQPASAYQTTASLMFASVATSNTGATVVRGRGATGAGRLGTGVYFVTFNRPIAGCTWLATYGVTNDGGSGPFFVTVEGRNFTNSPNDIEVRERDAAVATAPQTDGSGFHIEVLCP